MDTSILMIYDTISGNSFQEALREKSNETDFRYVS